MSRHPTNDQRPHQRLDPATRRALLVEAAAGVFRGRDPNEVGFEEVADAAGVSRSLVYAYFGDRGGLIAAVYRYTAEQLDADLQRSSGNALPDEARLRRVIRRYLTFARDDPEAWALIASAGAVQHPEVQAARQERVRRIAQGWPDEPSARLIAQAVLGMLEAGAQDWVEHRDIGVERATDTLLAVAWAGLAGLRDRGILVG